MSEAGGILGPGGPALWLRIRGRTVGAMVCAGFGAYSMVWWTLAAIHTDRQIWFCAIAAVAAIFVAWSIAHLAILRHAPRPALDGHYRRMYRIAFLAILTTEVVAISFGGPIMAHFERKDLYPQWVDLIVGLHFIPLGRLFKLPLYYATAAAIGLAVFGSLVIPPSPLRDAINAGGTGLALWLTALIILVKNLASVPANTAPVSTRD